MLFAAAADEGIRMKLPFSGNPKELGRRSLLQLDSAAGKKTRIWTRSVFLKSQDESKSSPEDNMRLKCAFSNNPRVQPLADGTVRIEGAECEWERGSPASLHLRHLKDDAFDVFEFSLSNFLIVRDRPEQGGRLRWQAIQVFAVSPI